MSTDGAIGGAERSLLGLIDGLDREQFDPRAVLFRDGPLRQELERRNVETSVVPVSPSLQRLSLRGRQSSKIRTAWAATQSIGTVLQLVQLIRRQRISLVHTNGLKAQLIGGAAARISGRPVLWHLRDIVGEGFWENRTARFGSRFATVIIANSEATKRSISARSSCPVVTVHNGVDTDRFHGAVDGGSVRRDFDLHDGVPLVAMVGMLTPWKGQEVFLRAARSVLARHPQARFAVIGDEIYTTNGHGTYAASLRAAAEALGLTSSVTFAGYRDDMPQVMAAIDLLVHASIQPEPFGRVLIEAMAAGKAVVATNAGGVPEIVIDGETGILVPPRDSESLAHAIAELLAAPDRRQRMGASGRERAARHFGLRQHVEAVTAIYRTVLEA